MSVKSEFFEFGPEKKEINEYKKLWILKLRADQIITERSVDFFSELENLGIVKGGEDKEQLINTEGWQETLAKSQEELETPLEQAEREFAEGKLSWHYVDKDAL
ncbi:MAG: hypothetical protein ACPGC9_00520 [Cytophagales bacterium]